MPLNRQGHSAILHILMLVCLSACITSILRTYYTWKIAQSPDLSYNIVPMGMWSCAELATGIVISCLPVIPKFFQHVGPKVSKALTLRSKSTGDSGNRSTPAAPSVQVRAEKLKLPGFSTFTSLLSNTEKDTDHEMSDQETLPQEEYIQLHGEMTIPRCDSTKELIQMAAPVKLATTRDDLEKGHGREFSSRG